MYMFVYVSVYVCVCMCKCVHTRACAYVCVTKPFILFSILNVYNAMIYTHFLSFFHAYLLV